MEAPEQEMVSPEELSHAFGVAPFYIPGSTSQVVTRLKDFDGICGLQR
jgi:hypothetical protein